MQHFSDQLGREWRVEYSPDDLPALETAIGEAFTFDALAEADPEAVIRIAATLTADQRIATEIADADFVAAMQGPAALDFFGAFVIELAERIGNAGTRAKIRGVGLGMKRNAAAIRAAKATPAATPTPAAKSRRRLLDPRTWFAR